MSVDLVNVSIDNPAPKGTVLEAPHGMKCVYVLESETGLVKIGVSNNFERRKRALETQSGFKMVNAAVSDPLSNYECIEKEMHKHFSSQRQLGEWFKIPFCEASSYLNALLADHGDYTVSSTETATIQVSILSEEEYKTVGTVLQAFKELPEQKREYLAGFLDGIAAMTCDDEKKAVTG